MSIQIAPDLEATIQERVASGDYRDVDAVVRAAIEALDDIDRVQMLRALISEGIESGDPLDFTPELSRELRIRADARARRGEPISRDVRP